MITPRTRVVILTVAQGVFVIPSRWDFREQSGHFPLLFGQVRAVLTGRYHVVKGAVGTVVALPTQWRPDQSTYHRGGFATDANRAIRRSGYEIAGGG